MRPDNWKDIRFQACMDLTQGGGTYRDVYEVFDAGADAMLEALKEEGVFTYGHHTPDISLDNAPSESGYWVFIPIEGE